MSCKWYTFKDGDYYCIKKREEVTTDWYYTYCRNYDYEDCNIYKGEDSGSSGCFITSACVEAIGLDDKCYELETLRNYRDTWLKNTDNGIEVIRTYYEIAPRIVSAINQTSNKNIIYRKIYEQMVLPCVRLIEEHKYQEALELYRNTTLELEKSYCGA